MSPSTSPENPTSTPTIDTQGPRDTDALYIRVQKDQKLSPTELRIFHEKFISTGKKTITENTGDELDRLLAGISDPEKNNIKNAVSTYLPTSIKSVNIADALKNPSAALTKAKEVAGTAGESISDAAQIAALGTSMAAISVAGTQVVNGDTKAIGGLVKGIKEVAGTVSEYIGDIVNKFMEATGLSKLFAGMGDIWKGIMSLFGVDIGDSAGTAGGADTPEAKAKAETDKKKEAGGNNIPKKTAEDLKNIEYMNMRDATWRHFTRLNTPVSTVVNSTKRKEFDARIDTYIQESGIADADIAGKKALLDTLKQKFTTGLSFSSILGFSSLAKTATTNIDPKITTQVDTQKGNIERLVRGLYTDKVIQIELHTEEIIVGMANEMEKYGWITPENRAQKIQTLKEKFGTGGKYEAMMADIKNTYITQEKTSNPIMFSLGLLFKKSPGILWDLLGDVIPWTAITVYAVGTGFRFGVRTLTALTTKGFDDGLSAMLDLDDVSKLPPEKRIIAITLLQQQGHLTMLLAGTAARIISTAALMPLYWTQGTGLSTANIQLRSLVGDYHSMANTMHSLTKDMLSPADNAALKGFDTMIRTQMIELETKMHIIDIYKKNTGWTNAQVHTELMKRMTIDGKSIHIGENLKIVNSTITKFIPNNTEVCTVESLSKNVFNTISHGGWWTNFLKGAKGLWTAPSASLISDQVSQKVTNFDTYAKSFLSTDSAGNNALTHLKALGMGTIPEMVNAIKNGEILIHASAADAEGKLKALKNVLLELPKGTQNLFNGVGLVVAITGGATAKEGEGLYTALSGIASMHVLGAAYVLYSEGGKMKDHALENPQYIASMATIGVLVATTTPLFIASVGQHGLTKAMSMSMLSPLSPILSAPAGVVNAVRTVNAIKGGSTISTVGQHIKGVIKGSINGAKGGTKALAVTASLLAIPSLIAAAFTWKNTEKMRDFVSDLEKDKILSINGDLDKAAISEKMKTWSKEKKELMIEFLVKSYLGDNSTYPKITDNNVDILIQPSADTSRHMTYGIVDSTEMDGLKTVLTQLGYTATIAYTTDADAVISGQAKKLLSEGYTQEQVDILNKQIRWTPVTVPTQSSGKNVSPSNLEEPTTSVSLGA